MPIVTLFYFLYLSLLWADVKNSSNVVCKERLIYTYDLDRAAHNAVVTCSVFTPNPARILGQLRRTLGTHDLQQQQQQDESESGKSGYVIVSGDYDGDIKVFYIFVRSKHSSLPNS